MPLTFRRLPSPSNPEGILVSSLSLGTSAQGGCFKSNTSDDEGVAVVVNALRSGINLIDTAPWYGQGRAERVIGRALAEAGIHRSTINIHTKAGRYEKELQHMFDFSAERTLRSIDESIARMHCGYLDCIQVHDPEYAPSIDILVSQTLPAMKKAQDAGKVKRIGLTGFPLSLHKEILERIELAPQHGRVQIDSCLLYTHYTLHDTSLLTDLLPFLHHRNIACINASPLCMGLLTRQGPPQWHPAPLDIREACRAASDYCAEKGVEIETLAVAFSLSAGGVEHAHHTSEMIATTLCSHENVRELKKNIEIASDTFHLSPLEQHVLCEIRTRFFLPLHNASWEGEEPRRYKAMMDSIARGEQVHGSLSTVVANESR